MRLYTLLVWLCGVLVNGWMLRGMGWLNGAIMWKIDAHDEDGDGVLACDCFSFVGSTSEEGLVMESRGEDGLGRDNGRSRGNRIASERLSRGMSAIMLCMIERREPCGIMLIGAEWRYLEGRNSFLGHSVQRSQISSSQASYGYLCSCIFIFVDQIQAYG